MKKIIGFGLFLVLLLVGFFGYRLILPSRHMHFIYHSRLLSDQQLDHMRMHPHEEPLSLTGKELYMQHVNLILRIQNEGDIYTGGSLLVKVEGTEVWHEIQVSEIAPKNSRNAKSFHEYVLPLGVQNFSRRDKPIHIDVDVHKMWVASHSGGPPKTQYFRPNFKYEYYLHSNEKIERIGDVAF